MDFYINPACTYMDTNDDYLVIASGTKIHLYSIPSNYEYIRGFSVINRTVIYSLAVTFHDVLVSVDDQI